MSDTVVINLPAKFDFGHYKIFHSDIESTLKRKPSLVVIDFSKVLYMDSSALGMLVLFSKKNSHSTKLQIKGAFGVAKDILLMANMDKIFDFS